MTQAAGTAVEEVDVLVVGAGLSGIGAACHLLRESPGRSVAVLEAREASGGTWDLFRYPGIRSDSDMFTLGYSFRPWRDDTSIADGAKILQYLRDTARENGVDALIRYGHRAVHASWSAAAARWTVDVEHEGSTKQFRCRFLFGNTGYYRYDEGYTPHFEGRESFAGPVVHPQFWPGDLEVGGKRVVVIGSGATAVTLVPALAKQGAQVTMLQRSPSYVIALPARDKLAARLRKVLPERASAPIVRWKQVALTTFSYQLSRRRPLVMKKMLRDMAVRMLPAGYDVDTHFSPRYDPWDQRLCVVPNGDLFRSISKGKAEIVTDGIETFTPRGVKLTSGRELEADVVVTATGLTLQILGGMTMDLDGDKVEVSSTVAYKGMMFSGIPNFALTLGYTNASWTLKADLVASYVARLLNLMDRKGYATVTPLPPPGDDALVPFLDLSSGYVLRSLDLLPKQGSRTPWRLHQNYARDILMFRFGKLEDEAVRFAAN